VLPWFDLFMMRKQFLNLRRGLRRQQRLPRLEAVLEVSIADLKR
jgi:hypothetical protein